MRWIGPGDRGPAEAGQSWIIPYNPRKQVRAAHRRCAVARTRGRQRTGETAEVTKAGGTNPTPDRGTDGLLLCGGAGRRVGGRDKGLLPFGAVTAAEAALDALRPWCDRVLISANRNLERYAAMPCAAVIRDGRSDFAGPLAGLEALRPFVTATRVLLLPCDAAGLPRDTPRRLLERLDALPDREIVFVRCGGRDHYLIAALRREALCALSEQLDRGDGRVRDWVTGLRHERLHLHQGYAATLNRNRASEW